MAQKKAAVEAAAAKAKSKMCVLTVLTTSAMSLV